MKTQTKPQHTQTPWHVYKQPTGDIKIYSEKGLNCPTIAIMWEKPSEANAQFIVRAVNSHDEQRQLLIECLQWFRVYDKEIESGRAWSHKKLKKMIEETLQKAGE